MTRPLFWKIARYTSLALATGSLAVAWSVMVYAAQPIRPHPMVQQLCYLNGGNSVRTVAAIEGQFYHHKCLKKTGSKITWISPDILVRLRLPMEDRKGWEVWEEQS